jgi:putative peptidoglycan lipid II flippase
VAAPILIMIFAPGFIGDAAKYDPAVAMLRLTFPYLLFISLTAFAGSILNTWGRFAVPAVTPVLLNLSLIAAAIWLSPRMGNPVMALAVGVFVAGVAQLLFQLPFLWRLGLLPRPRRRKGHEGVRRIMKLMMPALFGSSVAQINLLFDTLIASFLITGSVSWLYYSDRLVEFPLGVFGIALATVILPSLSRRHAEDNPERYSQTLDWALRWVVMIGLPAMLALILLAAPILTSLFQYGEFGGRDVRQASLSLMAYGLGLPAFILIKVQATGFFARQDTATPVRIGIIAMIANMFMNVLLVMPLIIYWFDAPHVGLALATSMSAWLQAWMLNHRLRKEGVYRPDSGWWSFGLRILLAVVAMSVLLWWLMAPLPHWLEWDAWTRIWQLAWLVVSGAVGYLVVLLGLGVRPWRL